jgi:hypothetical protein
MRLAVMVLMVAVAASGCASATHPGSGAPSAVTRAPASMPSSSRSVAAPVRGMRVTVVDTRRGNHRLAVEGGSRLREAGARVHLARVHFGPEATEVLYQPGHEAAALTVARLLGHVSAADAGVRVYDLDHAPKAIHQVARSAAVVVRIGYRPRLDDTNNAAVRTIVRFNRSCPSTPPAMTWEDARDAAAALVNAWPVRDGAIIDDYNVRGPLHGNSYRDEMTRRCGVTLADDSAIVGLTLTRYNPPKKIVAFMSCDTVQSLPTCQGAGWIVWAFHPR